MLYYLTELQRDGYIRSITTKDIPWSILKSAQKSGFITSAAQCEGHLIKPPSKLTMRPNESPPPLWAEGSLCGGFLTDRYSNEVFMPPNMSKREWKVWNSVITEWGTSRMQTASTTNRNNDPNWLWKLYQDNIVGTLDSIAAKHDVSIASVALRYLLQYHNVQTAIVSSRLSSEDQKTGARIGRRIAQYRQVFAFELDEADVEQLKYLELKEKALKKKEQVLTDHLSFEERYAEEGAWYGMEEDYERFLLRLEGNEEFEDTDEEVPDDDDDEYPEIDFDNKALWL